MIETALMQACVVHSSADACLRRALSGLAPARKEYSNGVGHRPLREAILFLLDHLEGVRAGHTRSVKVQAAGVKTERGETTLKVYFSFFILFWLSLIFLLFMLRRLNSQYSSGSCVYGTFLHKLRTVDDGFNVDGTPEVDAWYSDANKPSHLRRAPAWRIGFAVFSHLVRLICVQSRAQGCLPLSYY